MSRRLFTLLAATVAVLLGSAPAHAADPIEGVWSFNGGQVSVSAQPDGTFTGTVLSPTTLANCAHPTGEQMWLGVQAQPDGQYWGGHQWYTVPECKPVRGRGNSAFRVLVQADGARLLRACFAGPGSPRQPNIAPDGTSTDTEFGCLDSALISEPRSTPPTFEEIASLPAQGQVVPGQPARKCRTRRTLRIRLRHPRGDKLAKAVVYVNGKRVATRRGKRVTKRITLRRLPRGRYVVKIVAHTVLHKRIVGKRTYRTCARPKPRR